MLWTRLWCRVDRWLPLTFPAAGVRGMFRIPVIWIEGARPRQPEQRAWPASRQKGEAMPRHRTSSTVAVSRGSPARCRKVSPSSSRPASTPRFTDPKIERITLMKPARCGDFVDGRRGLLRDRRSQPDALRVPTESDARDYVVSDVEPIFEATPVPCAARG